MPLLVNIDTATEVASVCISKDGETLGLTKSKNQKEHACFIHAAIDRILENSSFKLKDLDAIAVTSGPGSYTGVRVGMATAKGFCFALSKPLIAINTLEVMTKAAIDTTNEKTDLLFCPMIDARRMEVFTAIYNAKLEEVLSPAAVILSPGLFSENFVDKKIVFFGSGSEKFKPINSHPKSRFEAIEYSAKHLGELGEIAFERKQFADISYSEPTYFKEFQSIAKTN